MNEFKTKLYEQLDKLDEHLATKNNSEKLLLGIVAGAGLAALVYFVFFDLSNNMKLDSEGVYDEIYSKVAQEEEYINSMDSGGFMSLEQSIREVQSGIASSKETLGILEKLTDEIYAHSKDWFLTFDDASKIATSMGLIVNGTDIKMSDKPALGGMKYSSFVLFGYGKFSAILKYIDWLEAYGKFISIESVIIESKDNTLSFSISIKNFRGGN